MTTLLPFPRYVRVKNALGQPEWLVRGLERKFMDDQGRVCDTPDVLLDRYYRHDGHIALGHSAIQAAGDKGYLRFAELPIDHDSIEYEGATHFVRYADLSANERAKAARRHG